MFVLFFFFYLYGDHRDLHVLTHPSPTRRSSDLARRMSGAGPLAGVRVLEFAAIGPAPFAAMLLAQMGAQVLRIERPGSDPLRPATPHDYLNIGRSEEHTSELQSLMRTSYAVFCFIQQQQSNTTSTQSQHQQDNTPRHKNE